MGGRMGIDLANRGRFKNKNKQRTDSKFTKTVLRRLVASRTNRPPLSLSKIIKHLGKSNRIAVTVSTVTDDARVLEVPKLTVAALRFTESARARITKAGGKCLTLDELVMQAPSGTNTLLLRANRDREARKHFGAAGRKRSHVMPYVRKGSEKKTGLSNRK